MVGHPIQVSVHSGVHTGSVGLGASFSPGYHSDYVVSSVVGDVHWTAAVTLARVLFAFRITGAHHVGRNALLVVFRLSAIVVAHDRHVHFVQYLRGRTSLFLRSPTGDDALVTGETLAFDWQTDRVDTGVGSEFNPIGVHPQQCDVVVIRSRTVTLVLDHSQHFEVDVFCFLCIATVVFQKSYADIFRFEPVYAMGGCHDVFVIDNRRAAVEFALVREHGHPRVLMHVRGGATDDSVFLTQSSASARGARGLIDWRYWRLSGGFFLVVNDTDDVLPPVDVIRKRRLAEIAGLAIVGGVIDRDEYRCPLARGSDQRRDCHHTQDGPHGWICVLYGGF